MILYQVLFIYFFAWLYQGVEAVTSHDVYAIAKLNDVWNDNYKSATTTRQTYFNNTLYTIYPSLLSVANYYLARIQWYYLREGSVIHCFNLTFLNPNPYPTMDYAEAVKSAILNAYPTATVFFAKEEIRMTRSLQQYKVNMTCTFNMTWLPDYSDLTSSKSVAFIADMEIKIKSSFNQVYVLSFASISVTSLRQGNVIADIIFYVTEAGIPLYSYQVQDAVNASFQIAYGTQVSIDKMTVEINLESIRTQPSIYGVVKFNDTWNDNYKFVTTARQNYINNTFYSLVSSFYFVPNYDLIRIQWFYLRPGSVIHCFNLTLQNVTKYSRPTPTEAVKSAILKAYPTSTIFFAKEENQLTRSLQQYKVNMTCTFNMTWLPDYSDLNSEKSVAFISGMETKIKSSFNQIYVIGFVNINVTSLRQGNVIVDMVFSVNETINALPDYQINDCINASFQIAYGAQVSCDGMTPLSMTIPSTTMTIPSTTMTIPSTTNVYAIVRFEDTWSDSYKSATLIRLNYQNTILNTLTMSFKNVSNYLLDKINWLYLRQGSVIHCFNLTLLNYVRFLSSNSTEAVQKAILNAYPTANILSVNEDKMEFRPLQQHKISMICTFNTLWLAEYNDLLSSNSKLFISQMESKIKDSFSQIYILSFSSITVTSLSQGSVIANIILNVNETLYPLQMYQIQDSISAAFQIAYDKQVNVTFVPEQQPVSTSTMTIPSTTMTIPSTTTGLIVGVCVGVIASLAGLSVAIYFIVRHYRTKMLKKNNTVSAPDQIYLNHELRNQNLKGKQNDMRTEYANGICN